MTFGRFFLLLALPLCLVSCRQQLDQSPTLGYAFVGPSTLTLRQDLSLKSGTSATVHHGEKLDILEYKRRFTKVRTAGGITGWTDARQLLTPDQMGELQHAVDIAAKFPSQGVATTSELLNVHTEPSRSSPSFLQIPEGGKMDVVGHKVMPRVQAPPAPPAPAPRPRPQRAKKKEKATAKLQPPPPPPAPALPRNWRELSTTMQAPEGTGKTAPAQPVIKDDWTMVRVKDGRVGWVLSRLISMAIPDEVAQYAEGHRITSYFQMGEVHDDEKGVKYNWLWTTVGRGPQNYEFDTMRFFIWSRRHHRYETAFMQKEMAGHYPVVVDLSGGKQEFTVIVEDDEERLERRTYNFNGFRVRLTSVEPYDAAEDGGYRPKPVILGPTETTQVPWWQTVRDRLASLFKH